MMNYRKDIASGKYYKNSKKELNNQIKQCFLDKKFGPGSLPLAKKTDEFKAFIMPHAGYDFSGCCAAHACKKIGENTNPEIIIILGVNHHGYGEGASIFPEGCWLTPLGKSAVDKDFNDELLKHGCFIPDELSHSMEHSIEVQLPFLQYIFSDEMPGIVPILINAEFTDNESIKLLGNALFKTWMKTGKRILFIASSDFSHVGEGYGFIPFKDRGAELDRKVKILDNELMQYLLDLDAAKAAKFADEKHLTVCGLSPILVLLQLLKNMKGKKIKGEILSHYTSADVAKDYDNFVDYASIEFKELMQSVKSSP
ncbi:AmmeMemoRadiSam system protein B [archaeon CG_4_10_14_0_2_um_filter_Archaea_38_6]|nr:MAG: AmmeMemoRadiSam system protein B [archaeon CG06_land_8_20_14_3_00_37_11]PJA22837.1 MAG: AmmeMemoRadiSam system protein B [archaeon CG_4_10_14_0_2_um_filter_Archaea_38_6]